MKEINLNKLFDIAADQAGSLEMEMLSFSDLLSDNFDLKVFLEDNGVNADNKKRLLEDLLPDASELFRRLFGLLAEQYLISRFSALAGGYSELVSRKTGTQLLTVTSARELDESERARIRPLIKQPVRFYFKVDPSLIGGARLWWEDGRLLDLSFSRSLQDLKEKIIA